MYYRISVTLADGDVNRPLARRSAEGTIPHTGDGIDALRSTAWALVREALLSLPPDLMADFEEEVREWAKSRQAPIGDVLRKLGFHVVDIRANDEPGKAAGEPIQ